MPPRPSPAESLAIDSFESPVGTLIAAADNRGVCLLEFTDRRKVEPQVESLSRRLGRALVPGQHPHLACLRAELAEYFGGRRRAFQVPIHASGTPFQARVWRELLLIPYGETRSYEQIALRIGAPKAVRAVGSANGRNPISILIPCHRVIGKDGSTVGYGGGIPRKEWLLDLERGAGRPTQLRLPVAGVNTTRLG
jgi:AraC family transcriptional regulator of adaptative response/methylated-DNA-[protein]-cysteine methyltransferase